MKRKSHIILEFNEFNFQRMNPDTIPQAMHVDNPELSTDSFDRHTANIMSQQSRLGAILNTLANSGNIYNIATDKIIHGQNITGLKIKKMVPLNNIDLNVFIEFTIGDKEYWGVIESFIRQPKLDSEAFRDPHLYTPKEWVIKTKGLIIKAINKWLEVKPGSYKALKDIFAISDSTGERIGISENEKVEVLRTYDDNKILAKTSDGKTCILRGYNYYYFNWWFEKIN